MNLQKYIEEENIESEINVTVLNKIKEIETSLNKNIEEFSSEELYDSLKELNYSNLIKIRAFLVKYFDWLVANKEISKNIFNENKQLSIRNINASKDIDDLFQKDDLEILLLNLSMFPHLQFIVYSSWLGITVKELSRMKVNDIDKKYKVALVENNKVMLDDKFMMLFERYDESNTRKGVRRNTVIQYYKDYLLKVRFDPRSRVLKDDEEFSTYASLQWSKYINVIFNEFNIDITLAQIKKAGIRYKVKENIENSGIKVTSNNLYSLLSEQCLKLGLSETNFWNDSAEYFKKIWNLK